MVLRNSNETTPDIRKLQLQISSLYDGVFGVGGIQAQINTNTQNIGSLLNSRVVTPPYPVGNLLYNGEIGHSVNSWYDGIVPGYVTTNKAYEAAWWWSHSAPVASQTFTNADVGTNQITLTAHPYTTGMSVAFTSTLTLPTGPGITSGVIYYVIYIDANTIAIATSVAGALAGSARGITAGTGSGTMTIQQVLNSEDAQTNINNTTLKSYLPTGSGPASTYTPYFSRWNRENGWAELTTTTTVDQMLPTNFIDSTTPLARVSMIASKANSYVEITDECLMGCGIWDNTIGQDKFLEGDIGFTASLNGAAGAVERRYRVLLTSDRGYQLLSSEVTIANAPADGAFTATNNIGMSWGQQSGQLQVDIYEYLPTGGSGGGAPEYRLLTQVSAATSYIHEGAYLRTVSGYPTPTGTIRNATYYTQVGDMANLATNGVSAQWDTINFPIDVPDNYNKANTTGRQWLRLFLTVAPNLLIDSVTTDGSATITIPSGAVNSAAFASGGYGTGGAGSSLYYGLTVEVYDSALTLITTTTVSSVTSDTVLVLAASVAAGSDRIIRIVGGGFHGVFLDKIHMGYQQNTSYAPNANDNRTLQPVAAPSSSSQGGVGSGGTGGGISCVSGETPVKMAFGNWKQIQTARPGYQWAAAGLQPNLLVKMKQGFDRVRRVRTANGVMVEATDSERFVVDRNDHNGTTLIRLRVGDTVLTEIDDRVEASKIVEISTYLRSCVVYTPSLDNNHLFVAGQIVWPWWKRLWFRLTHRRKPMGGFVLHNRKPPPEDPTF